MMEYQRIGDAHASRGDAGITLVEMMVVVGAIVLLAGMLLGGLNIARAEARRLACARNLGQIGQLAGLYAAENGGRVVPFGDPASDPLDAWYMDLASLAADDPGKQSLTDPDRLPTETEIFMCPEDSGNFAFDRHNLSYGLNADVMDDDGIPYTSTTPGVANDEPDIYYFDNMVNPADFILIADSGEVQRQPSTERNYRSWIASNYLRVADRRPASAIHRERVNVLFGDLHVDWREGREFEDPQEWIGINARSSAGARPWTLGNR